MSPMAGRDPLSGDTSYTESLLEHPPAGVEYTSYDLALRDGTLWVRGRRRRHGNGQPADRVILVARATERLLRRSRIMFREPNWYCTVDPAAYDLIHLHQFPARQVGPHLPVVSSAGYPLPELYRVRERWRPIHLNLALRLESATARLGKVDVPWLSTRPPGIMTVYTEHYREWLVARGIPKSRILLAGTAVPDLGLPERRSDGRTVGFIGRDFARKGGHTALATLRLLRAVDPAWHMVVVTSGNYTVEPREPSLDVIYDVERDDLLHTILPRLDILLLPTESDCGAPYGLIEALQAGVCAVISDYPWLDRRLRPPAVATIRTDPVLIADHIRRLTADDLQRAQTAARKLWEEEFSMKSLHMDLLRAYDLALSQTVR